MTSLENIVELKGIQQKSKSIRDKEVEECIGYILKKLQEMNSILSRMVGDE